MSTADEKRQVALEQAVAAKNDSDNADMIVDSAEKFFKFLENR